MAHKEHAFFLEGRMISASKSGYMVANPGHVVAFNANLCVKSRGLVWNGDIDVTADANELMKFAKSLGEDIYVLRESSYHYSNKEPPNLDLAIAIVSASEVKLTGQQ